MDKSCPSEGSGAKRPENDEENEVHGGGLISIAIDRPVSVLVAVILIVLFGGITFGTIPIQLTPDITRPSLSVQTTWPGASPVEVESEILEQQEEVLKSLPGLVRMVSTASLGSGRIELELEVGSSLQEGLVRASNLLSQVQRYPENVDNPVVNTANSSGPPLGVVLIQPSDGSSIAMNHYQSWAQENIVPRFERIPGVSEAGLRGGQESQIEIAFDPRALAARGVTLTQLQNALRAELRDISAGDITLGKRRLLVRTPVAPDVPADFAQVVIAMSGEGVPIRVRDVAVVREGFRKKQAQVIADGKDTLAILLFREAGTNVLEVTEQVRATVDELDQEVLAPLGMEIRLASDQTEYIYGALDLVRQNLFLGGFFAIIVLLTFLRNVAASLVVAVAIPVSMVATVLGMALLGRTINVVSLAGMAFAVGMVVDNAIVVLENIETWRARGFKERLAALAGAKEVWGAILASTATTAAVFLPIIGWQDEVGELLRDIAVAISIAVVASLFVSVLVIPSFSASILRLEHTGSFALPRLEAFGNRFRSGVSSIVDRITASLRLTAAVTLFSIVASIVVAVVFLPPLEYLPAGNRNLVFGILVPPAGYSVEEMERIGRSVQATMLEHTGVEKDGVPAIGRSFFVGAPERGFMGAEALRGEDIGGVQAFMQEIFGQIPGVFGIAVRSSLFGRSLGGGRSIEVEVKGRDLDRVISVSGTMLGRIKGALPDAQVRPVPSLDLGAPELHVTPRREQLTEVGMNGSDLGLLVDALVDGAIVGEFGREGEPRVDVVIEGIDGEVTEPSALRSAPVATPTGALVPLGTLSDVEERMGPTSIQRIERRRTISLQITPPDDVPLEEAIRAVRVDVIDAMRDDGSLPSAIEIKLAGTAGDLELAKGRFANVLLLAVIISFLLMAALFEDFLAPLVVMITVPLAAAGGVLGLRLVDATLGPQPLDLVTALGFVILVGVVVNNAILVVDGALARLRNGDGLDDAIRKGVEGRVRPIFMSALTSLAGLLPLVLFPGSGSELYRGIGAVVLGGLALSTVMTLFVVPAFFVLLWRVRLRRSGVAG